jgi:hypothetical protein
MVNIVGFSIRLQQFEPFKLAIERGGAVYVAGP